MAMNHTMDFVSTVAQTAPVMNITHYRELLMTNQPWNLIFFMTTPVILVELLVASEFFVTFNRLYEETLRTFNKYLGTFLGFYLFGISLLELGVIGKGFTRENKMKTHFILLIGFLFVAHFAMIFGMATP